MKQLRELLGAATLHPGDRADLAISRDRGAEAFAHAEAAGDEVVAARALEAQCVFGATCRGGSPRASLSCCASCACRAPRATTRSQGLCAPAAAAARGEGDDALRDVSPGRHLLSAGPCMAGRERIWLTIGSSLVTAGIRTAGPLLGRRWRTGATRRDSASAMGGHFTCRGSDSGEGLRRCARHSRNHRAGPSPSRR